MLYQDLTPLITGLAGAPLFWSHMPATPDALTTVYEYPGDSPVYSKTAMEWERPRIQVVTRALTYAEAMQKAEDIYGGLSTLRRDTLNGTFYDSIRANQRPFADPNGRDDKGRFRVFCNYAIKKAP